MDEWQLLNDGEFEGFGETGWCAKLGFLAEERHNYFTEPV
jgi:hypothetical protein